MDPNLPANPCGLVAKSYFNDTFLIYRGTENITLNDKGIAWESDVKFKFKNCQDPPTISGAKKTWEDVQWISVEDGKLNLIMIIIF